MKSSKIFTLPRFLNLVLFLTGLMTPLARADWQRDESSLAWRDGTNVVWRFSFDPKKGKTFFDPVAVRGTTLSNFKPADHPWHYGLWFSWKYINQANYWEEDRETGKAEGATRWVPPEIQTQPDGSAVIRLMVSYTHPTGRVDLLETRALNISALKADGGYSIDWRSTFKAGDAGAILDRTPMPNEPDGKVNGGYAGLGLRMAGPPLTFSVVCSTGVVNQFVSDRARPSASALACNFADQGREVGGIALLSDPANAGEHASWYVVNSREMRFACAAILAPKVITLKPGEEMKLHYKISVSPKSWTPEALQAETIR
jgi:hypothetical protein